MKSATEVKTDRKYTTEHEWAADRGAEILVGISAFAVDQLGDITLVNLDVKSGDSVQAHKAFGTIESVKTLSDLFAPVSGKVIRVNGALENSPELINEDPWEKGWLIAILPSKLDEEMPGLLDAVAYSAHLETAGH